MSTESIQAAKDQLFSDHETKAATAKALAVAKTAVSISSEALISARQADSDAQAAIDRAGIALQGELSQP